MCPAIDNTPFTANSNNASMTKPPPTPSFDVFHWPNVQSVDSLPQYDSSAPSSRASSPQFEDEDDEISEDDENEMKLGSESRGGRGPPSSSSSSLSSSGKPLFLNFTSDLSLQEEPKKKQRAKKQATYKVNGVNILNRTSVDSKTAIERMRRRRENHNYVERRRRDNINHTIVELSELVPEASQPNAQKPNKGNILRLTVDYVRSLQDENLGLRAELEQLKSADAVAARPAAPAASSASPRHHHRRASPPIALPPVSQLENPPVTVSAEVHPHPSHNHRHQPYPRENPCSRRSPAIPSLERLSVMEHAVPLSTRSAPSSPVGFGKPPSLFHDEAPIALPPIANVVGSNPSSPQQPSAGFRRFSGQTLPPITTIACPPPATKQISGASNGEAGGNGGNGGSWVFVPARTTATDGLYGGARY